MTKLLLTLDPCKANDPDLLPTLPYVLHVYYMCNAHVIYVWCFRCITIVIHTPVIHMFHTCNIGAYPTLVLHMLTYMCNTGVYSTYYIACVEILGNTGVYPTHLLHSF